MGFALERLKQIVNSFAEAFPSIALAAPRPSGLARAITENLTAPAQKAAGVNPAEHP